MCRTPRRSDFVRSDLTRSEPARRSAPSALRPIVLIALLIGSFAAPQAIRMAAAASASGVIEWSGERRLGLVESGRLARVETRIGAVHRRGDLLLALDPQPFDLAVEQAAARRDALRPQRDEMARELQRAEEMYAATLISTVELQRARNASEQAAADYHIAETEWRRARLAREESELRADTALRVLQLHAVAGEIVVNRLQAQPLLSVADAGRMAVRVEVPAADLHSLPPGREVAVRVAGERHSASVVGSDPRAVLREGAVHYTVYLRLPVVSSALLPVGLSAEVEY